ncbi:HAD family hydrolase [Streptomyces sp. PTM05]|uniref:HAD family hydrolase n=1 Tax=Streptantibioticus parmotrematis TaxID=2873249 RepID=A0ABS7QVW6_9ACTN|nr:HAD family hydrolase [Streptantibioticus parmotrematis]MBY8887351.1 HAD family hydrolase [Streptantibioticus parmotrematis]
MTTPQPTPGTPSPTAPATSTVIATDLDRTLIYSTAALALGMPDEQAPRLLCVEVYNGRPLSFITERAAELVQQLAARAALVPVTTRTRAQYHRVHLPGPPPKYAICANGGHILIDGRTDRDWHDDVRRTLADGCAPLAEVLDHLVAAADPAWLRTARVAEDLFAYLVVERSGVPEGWLKELQAWTAERGWTASLQGRKIYAVPRPLTKSAALAEVVRRTGADRVLAAGDSLLDTDLLLAADRAWRPGHGELAETGWNAPNVTALDTVGVAAGEAILLRMSTWTEATRIGQG